MFYSLLQGNEPSRILGWIIGIVGLLANSSLLLYHFKRKLFKSSKTNHHKIITSKSRSITKFLIRQLALADLLGSLYVIIISSADSYYGYRYPEIYQIPNPSNQTNIWTLNPLCHIARFCFSTSSVLSIAITLVIAYDRLVAVIFPHSKARLNLFKSRIVISVCWLICCAFGLIPTIRGIISAPYFAQSFNWRLNICMYTDIVKIILTIFFRTRAAIYFGCCSSIALIYVVIIVYVRNKRRRIASGMNQIERRIFIVMMIITAVNVCSLLPSTIIYGMPYNIRQLPHVVYATSITIMFTFSNAAINPFIYIFLSSSRKRYIVCCGNSSKVAVKNIAVSENKPKSTEVAVFSK
ncbi:G-protein coupled receptor GRL101-like protein [Trichoplax sp. H2]|nr:G-protein coupled receptor GRL101-like protein [Trichoplax sp. H2]RDD47650.1 G-protein coupled receptor GRL101-like protein [Trichoplax sp. H2]|eukprot:RDD39021.1 G-protein coupled receptor GRL101-like protein [Trichoplax sp. H2]